MRIKENFCIHFLINMSDLNMLMGYRDIFQWRYN
jgi:hypothetical protein